MAAGDLIRAELLSARVIPQVDRSLASRWGFTDGERSAAVLTCNIDDSLYAAADQATKEASVRVAYGSSFYAGSAHSSGPLSGEAIVILAAATPADAESGLSAAADALKKAVWISACSEDRIVFFSHTVSRCGSYLAGEAGIAPDSPLAYLVAPPAEAQYGLDLALKAASVKMCTYFAPPSPTNYSGALLTGSIADCEAACSAFSRGVCEIAAKPFEGRIL